MAGEIQIDSVTALTASGSNIVLNNVDTATNRTNLGLGSIATQAANSVSISGGNITGGTIGSGVVFPAGHLILLSSSENTSAVASVEFNNTVITSTYKHYILRIHKIIPATDSVSLNLGFSTNNGSSFRNVATGKVYSQVGASGTGPESTSETTAGLSLGNNLGNDADVGQSAEISIFGSQDTNYNYFDVKGWISGKHISAHYGWWTTGYVNHAKTAINFLKLSYSSGNIAKHNLSLYGIK